MLRLCSVFGVPDRAVPAADLRFDAVGGMQNHTGHLTLALDALGVRQTVVTSRPPSQPRTERLGHHAVVHRHGWPVPVARQGWALGAARTLAAATAGVQVVHAHLGEDLAVLPLARATARARDVPLVVTVHMSLRHTLPVRGARSALLRVLGGAVEASTCAGAAATLVLTERLADAVRAEHPGARVLVVPSGVDPVLFADPLLAEPDPLLVEPDPLADPTRPELAGRPRVLFVGRLGAQKDVASLVRAAAVMRTDADVVVAGAGPDAAGLEVLVRRLGVGHRVRLTGNLDHRAVPAALRTAAVAVQPSRYEELGTSILEAMAAGVPVVATRTGGIPSLVRDGESGVLVAVGDPPALAAALDAVLADPARARRLAEGGRAVAAGYTWPVLAERVSEVYAAVTGAAPASPAGQAGRASSSGAAVDGVGAQPLPDPA